MSNQVGGYECSREADFLYYDLLPVEWKRWIQEYEFSLNCEAAYVAWIGGGRLDDIRQNTDEVCRQFKWKMGYVVGYNGVR